MAGLFSCALLHIGVFLKCTHMSVRTKTSLFNAALTRHGHAKTTEAEGGPLWTAMDTNYADIVLRHFEAQEYPFGKDRYVLTSRQEGDFGYEDKFVMPNGVMHVLQVYLDDIKAETWGQAWEVDASDNALLIDANKRTVAVEVIVKGQEDKWSAWFATAVQRDLEAVIKSVLEETSEANALASEAEYTSMKAGVKASKNRSERRVRRGGRLIQAHFGWRGRR